MTIGITERALDARRRERECAGSEGSWAPWPLRWQGLGHLLAAYAALAAIGLASGFTVVHVLAQRPFWRFDEQVSDWFVAARSGGWNTITAIGSHLAATLVVIAVASVAVGAMVLIQKRWRDGLVLLTALALEVTVFVTISMVVGRDRPPVERLDQAAPTGSFPSGHTAAGVALYLGLALLLSPYVRSRLAQGFVWLVGLLAATGVAVSRIYRGMHYVSDVVAGVLLGAACLVLAVLIVDAAVRRRAAAELTEPTASDLQYAEAAA